uniref:Uncharacterized protein n=1 Tax=Moniliophthora roreri TaxID=221103 RepID=A0A0W0GB72_MONRR
MIPRVCTAFLALSLLEKGYKVFANFEAYGTYSRRNTDEANDRMRVGCWSERAVVTDLMGDWRQTLGYPESSSYFDQYFPVYGMVERNFKVAAPSS